MNTMKKEIYIAAVALMTLLAMACGNRRKVELKTDQDSIIADTPALDTNKIGAATDTPALGTDNIRMDSMNNSKQ